MKKRKRKMKKQAVLSLSGGMDSGTLLLHLLRKGYEVTVLSFDYGQKHRIELMKAQSLVEYVNRVNKETKKHPPVNHHIITLDGLKPLLQSNLVEGGAEVPEGHYESENMKQTVVPNRNKIFSSIIQAVALSLVNKTGWDVQIAMGIHAGDHTIYPDCRQEFRDADYRAFVLGNWGAERVTYYTPYLEMDKFGILQDGEKSCEVLGLNFNMVYSRTNTSYKPIEIKGAWYSDYRSASSVERIEAFIKLGRPDPVPYADENGPVEWEDVVAHVQGVLQQEKIV